MIRPVFIGVNARCAHHLRPPDTLQRRAPEKALLRIGERQDRPRSAYTLSMTLELAVLEVRPGLAEPFEEAFSQAKDIIARAPGFIGLELQRCSESEKAA
jgi:hypothetical protein